MALNRMEVDTGRRGSDLELLTEKEAALIATKSVAWMQRERWKGTGPEWLKIGAAVRYDRQKLEAWLRAQTPAH